MQVLMIDPSKGTVQNITDNNNQNNEDKEINIVKIIELHDGRYSVEWDSRHPMKHLLRANVWTKKYTKSEFINDNFHPCLIESKKLKKMKRLLESRLFCDYKVVEYSYPE